MVIFFYDKTFEGLLTAVFDAYNRKTFPQRLMKTNIAGRTPTGRQASPPKRGTLLSRRLFSDSRSCTRNRPRRFRSVQDADLYNCFVQSHFVLGKRAEGKRFLPKN